MAKDTQINIRITTALKAAAEKAAAADERSLTSLISKLLSDFCRERGFLISNSKSPKRKRG